MCPGVFPVHNRFYEHLRAQYRYWRYYGSIDRFEVHCHDRYYDRVRFLVLFHHKLYKHTRYHGHYGENDGGIVRGDSHCYSNSWDDIQEPRYGIGVPPVLAHLYVDAGGHIYVCRCSCGLVHSVLQFDSGARYLPNVTECPLRLIAGNKHPENT